MILKNNQNFKNKTMKNEMNDGESQTPNEVPIEVPINTPVEMPVQAPTVKPGKGKS